MIIGDDAASAMYRYLRKNSKTIGISESRIFKNERPKKVEDGEYVVVNSLPFVHSNTIEEGVINVNIHAPKTASDEPNSKRLSTIVKCLLSLFEEDIYLQGAYFSFYSDSRPTPDNDNTYYINLKFNVTYNNLKN